MPWTVSRHISVSAGCPASAACRAATAGHSTRSPSTPSSGSSLTRPGRSSSIGNASTSVAPDFSIHRWLSVAIVASSTTLMHSSARGWTRIRSITKRESLESWESSAISSSEPDSSRTSMLICGSTAWLGSCAVAPLPQALRGLLPGTVPGAGCVVCVVVAGFVVVVRRDDVADEAVSDHVLGGEPVEVDILNPGEDVLDDPQAALRATGQVDLGDVAGDDLVRAEAESGEKHLHLFRRGVLRLVQDDERVVEGPATHVGQGRDLDGARREQLGDRLGVEHVVQGVVQ